MNLKICPPRTKEIYSSPDSPLLFLLDRLVQVFRGTHLTCVAISYLQNHT